MLNEQLFLSGDFDTLYTNNIKLIYSLANKFYNTGIEKEDLVGLMNVAFTKAIKSFDPEKAKWTTYFCRAAQNEVLMYLRTERKLAKGISLDTPVGQDDNAASIGDLVADTNANTEESAIETLRTRELYNIINTKLNERQKEIVTLKLQGKTQSQIANIMGIAQPSVSRNEKSAYAILKQYLNLSF